MDPSPYRIVALQASASDAQKVERLFSRKEFTIETFCDSRQFIRYMRMQPAADCLITDVELKDIDGVELVSKVRANERWKKTPVVVLASSVDKATLIALTRLSINSYIVKPYQPKRLLEDALRVMGLEMVTQTKAVLRVKSPSNSTDESNS